MKKRSLLLRIPILALLMATVVYGGVAAEPSASAVTQGTVQITNIGEFSVELCQGATFTAASVNSHTGQWRPGGVQICYMDSEADRHGFTVTLRASDFNSITPGVNASFSNENLYIYRTQMPQRMSEPFLMPVQMPGLPSGVGTIYATRQNDSLPMGSSNGVTANPVLAWPRYTYSLETAQVVNRADAGIGTSVDVEGTLPTITSTVRLDLWIPPGTRPATYQSEITLELTFITP